MRLWTRAMPVGFQPIREFPGISRCWDVEGQRSLVLCCGGSLWQFWRRQMPLQQQNLVEISDFEIPTVRIPLLISSTIFYPKSETYYCNIFSHIPMVHEAHQRWRQNNKSTGENSELSLILNASFTLCQTKRLKFGSKSQGSPIFGRFFFEYHFDAFFERIFFPQLPEPPGSDSPGTPSQGHNNIHLAAQDGNVPALRHFLRVAPERVHEKGSFWPAASKNG